MDPRPVRRLRAPPETRDATVEALEGLARSPAALHALQANAKRAYDANFGRERAADAWDRLLADAVRRRAR